MNRQAAIRKARELILAHHARINNKPVITIHDNGNFQVKIGTGGLLVRLARPQSGLDEPEPGLSARVGEREPLGDIACIP